MTYFGVRKIIAWHLWNSMSIGSVFTVEQLEHWVQAAMISQGQTGKRVEVDRRLRQLRECGYVIHSHYSDGTLAANEYRLISRGKRIWGDGELP